VKLRNALLASAMLAAALAAATAPALASPARAHNRWQLTPVGSGQPDCLISKHAIGPNRGFVFSSRNHYKITFLIDVTGLPRGKVDVYVSSLSGDGYGGNSDYGGFGGCPTKRIKLATVRVLHGYALVAASTTWLPVDAAVYVSVKRAGSTATSNYATSSVFFP
jgi:hypothetical protein